MEGTVVAHLVSNLGKQDLPLPGKGSQPPHTAEDRRMFGEGRRVRPRRPGLLKTGPIKVTY